MDEVYELKLWCEILV